MNQLDFDGRTAVVTGGAAGIGFAVAQRLVASGARVALWDRDAAALAKAQAALGGDTLMQALDVADAAGVEARPRRPPRRSGASTRWSARPASPGRTRRRGTTRSTTGSACSTSTCTACSCATSSSCR